MRERLSPLTLLTANFRQNKIAPSLTILSIAFILILSTTSFAQEITRGRLNIEEEDSSPSVFPYKIKVSNATLTDNSDGTVSLTIATGDITSVGDCTSGACFDGTQGTLWTFNNASGDQTLKFDDTTQDFEFSNDVSITDITPHLKLIDSTAAEDDFEIYTDASQFVLTNTTDGIDILYVTSSNNIRLLRPVAVSGNFEVVSGNFDVTNGNFYVGINNAGNAQEALLLETIGTGSLLDLRSGATLAGATSKFLIDKDGNTTFVGAIDAGGATSFKMPYGANITVNEAGKIGQDTTDDQLLYGATPRVLAYTYRKCLPIENLAAADDNYEFYFDNDAITITEVGVHCRGTCTTAANIALEDRSGNAMTHTTPTASTGTNNTTWQAVTAANSLVAGEGLRFDVTNAVSPETDEYIICFGYTYDRQ